MPKLTEKQKRFCEEYLIDLNATRAYKVAYPNVKKEATARANASRLLTNANIKKNIKELQKIQSERTQITVDRVLKELAAIAFSDRTELAQVVHRQGTDEETGEPYEYAAVELTETKDLPSTTKKIIAGIKHGKNGVVVSSYDKLKALELLGKHIGMFEGKTVQADGEKELPKLLDTLKNE